MPLDTLPRHSRMLCGGALGCEESTFQLKENVSPCVISWDSYKF